MTKLSTEIIKLNSPEVYWQYQSNNNISFKECKLEQNVTDNSLQLGILPRINLPGYLFECHCCHVVSRQAVLFALIWNNCHLSKIVLHKACHNATQTLNVMSKR